MRSPRDQVDVLDVDDVLAEPLGGEPLQLEPVPRRRARPRSARWRRRCGTSASRSAPAGRGAARRAPCGPGSAGASRRPRPGAAARPWPARTPRSRPRRRRPTPSCTSHVHWQTASRNHRSWVTTTSADGRGDAGGRPARRPPRRRGGWSARRARPGRGRRAAARPASSAAARRRTARATARSRATPASSTSTTSRVRGSAAHSWSDVPAEHRLADGVGVDELVALVEVADQQPALPRDPAGVGLLEAGHHLEQRGLAVAVAADDADPLARADAERDVGEQRADAVGLGDPLEVEQVGHQAYSTSVRAGDRAVGDQHDVVVASGSAPATVAGVVGGLAAGRRRSGRSRRPCRAARRRPRRASISVAEVGAQVERGGLQVVVQRARPAARGRRSASAASTASAAVGRLGRRRGRARRSAGRPPASTGPSATGRRPTTRCRGRRPARPARRGRCRARCRRPARTARRCRARRRARSRSSSEVSSVPEPVQRDQRGGRVGRAAGHARRRPGSPWRCATAAARARRRGARPAGRAARSTMLSPVDGHGVGVDRSRPP